MTTKHASARTIPTITAKNDTVKECLQFWQMVVDGIENNTGICSEIGVCQPNSHGVNSSEMLPRARIALLQSWFDSHDVLGGLTDIDQAFDNGTLRFAITNK